MSTKLSQSQYQRLQFMESCLLWEGKLQRKDVCDAFGLTLNHVTRDISAYRKTHPKNLVFDPEGRTWRIGPAFKPAYASGAPEEYLAMLHAYARGGDPSILTTVGPMVPAQALPAITGKIDRNLLREVVSALRQETGVIVKYQSFSEAEPNERTLWPHALVFALDRWHVRAFDSRKQRFGDFVLARITKARPTMHLSPVKPDDDRAWQDSVTLEVIAAPTLSASQQAAVVREYGMERHGKSWAWQLALRRCLAPYFLHAHRLDLPAGVATHRRIALKDPTLAKEYAFSED